MGVSSVTAQEAKLLGTKPDEPALVYHAVVFDQHGQPIEYLKSVNYPQRVVFKTRHGEISW